MADNYEIIDMLKEDDDCVLVCELIDDEFKTEVLKQEMKRLDELVPFINKGMDDAFKQQEALVLVRKHGIGGHAVTANESTFTLRTEGGEVIGETIYDEEELEELRNDPSAYFLSDNFVTYQNKAKPGQKQFFVLEAESCEFVTDKDIKSTVSSLKVAIPSTETDHYIKDYYGIPHDTHIGTVIIGFTPKE